MRLPKEGEDLTGKVCVSSCGRAGIVCGEKVIDTETDGSLVMWIGMGFDGKGTWASTQPGIIAESLKEYHDRLYKRFGGKLSHNG